MDDRELEVLLRDIESDRVERTISTTDGEKFRQAICAFANDLPNHQKPGVLFIGAHVQAVYSAYQDFSALAREIAYRTGVALP